MLWQIKNRYAQYSSDTRPPSPRPRHRHLWLRSPPIISHLHPPSTAGGLLFLSSPYSISSFPTLIPIPITITITSTLTITITATITDIGQ